MGRVFVEDGLARMQLQQSCSKAATELKQHLNDTRMVGSFLKECPGMYALTYTQVQQLSPDHKHNLIYNEEFVGA